MFYLEHSQIGTGYSIAAFPGKEHMKNGNGVYDRVMKAMELLKNERVLFGFSATLTRDNIETVAHTAFLRHMIEKGCLFGFYNELVSVAGGGMHINAQGWVEPCPFAHYARENVATSTFSEVLGSPFLEAIRDHPTSSPDTDRFSDQRTDHSVG